MIPATSRRGPNPQNRQPDFLSNNIPISNLTQGRQSHQHARHLRNTRNHAQRAHNNGNGHPNDARRAPVHKPVLRRKQDALPRRLEDQDEAYDGDEAEIASQLLALAHAGHVVDVLRGAAFLRLECFMDAEVDVGGGIDFDLRI